jgi:hypothetical protein
MEAFEYWTEWGSGLNDRDFANAFTALGILKANFAVKEKQTPDNNPQADEQHLSMLTNYLLY